MEIFNTPNLMQKRCLVIKSQGLTIAFVPTMGGLHKGHLSLVDIAKTNADIVVMSIYLNPTQFSTNEDLSSYPASLEKDLELAKEKGVDIIFCPTNEAMYPQNFQTTVETTNITKNLCGFSRPEHFKGVTTIVLKLFNIVKPDIAIFGKKDYQQLQVIKQMVQDLNIDTKIIGAPIIREKDGLAMSSRNNYLNMNERVAAKAVNQALKLAEEKVKNGETNSKNIITLISKHIETTNIGKIDYIKVCHRESLTELEKIESPALIAVAAHFGKARLIDNCEV